MNKHVPPAKICGDDPEYLLAALRCTSQRIKLIDHEVIQIGVALKRGLISPQCAIDWCNEVAPGCLDVVSQTMEVTP